MSNNTFRILLVEDNPFDARLTSDMLKENKNHEVIAVRDGEEAIRLLKGENGDNGPLRPDLILLDLKMPRRDGRAVLQAIKGEEELKRIPVVILTTSQDKADIRSAYDLGANCFVTKPMGLDRFSAAVKAIEHFWLTVAELPED